jgi:zinc/manganese transport system substrate-binding protein
MKRWRPILALAFALLLPASALAELDIVASSSSTGALVREIAGEHAQLTILAPPDRDLHHLQARPSIIRALRGADLVVALGAEIEVGWLPLAITQAANPGIQPGRAGYFEAAAQVTLLDAGGPADRALGDVHPVGNPHVNLDPLRMAQIARALAERLAQLEPANAALYRERADAFAEKTEQRVAQWQALAKAAPGAVAYHRDLLYLLERMQTPLLGTIEATPGVPPSGAHLKDLADRLKGREGVLLYTVYQPAQGPEFLADKLGWPMRRLPMEPPMDADGDAYLSHMDQWVRALLPDAP